jgi:multiple sugar transport system ATP-binding protein
MDVYYNPSNLFVARFIGSPGMNLVKGTYSAGAVTMHGANRFAVPGAWKGPLGAALGGQPSEVIVGFRPEASRVTAGGELAGEVYAADMHGAYTVLHVNINENEIVHIRSDRQTNFPIGTRIRFDIDPEMVRFFHPGTEAAVRREAT